MPLKRTNSAKFIFAAAAWAFVSATEGASLVRYLDPYTMLRQTDDPAEGREMAAEPGYWPSPNGQIDPLAKTPQARVMHNCYTVSDRPFPEYDASKPSPLFKVNQVGYMPEQPKFVYMGAWLGPKLGAWRPHGELGAWRVMDAKSDREVLKFSDPPVCRIEDEMTKDCTLFTGERTYEMDISALRDEGTYYVVVDGIGRSPDFRVWKGAAEDAFRVHMSGLYQKRCGIAKTEPYTHWTFGPCHTNVVRGTFAPEEAGLTKGVRWFEVIRHNTFWDGEKLPVSGGWHDAADYDRRPAHLSIVNSLCAVYLMHRESFRDGQLAIPENANEIPDILDEAEWGLRHLLQLQQADGGVGTWIETVAHPGPGSVVDRDDMQYAVSRATRSSSLDYAAHASLLARCHESFREKYLESAKRAWDFAIAAKPSYASYVILHRRRWLPDRKEEVTWTEPKTLTSRSLLKAAVNLHALTGDTKYLETLASMRNAMMDDFRKNEWHWDVLTFAGERELGFPKAAEDMMSAWESKVMNRARDMVLQSEGAYAYRCPWWFPGKGWCQAMSWGHSHPLRRAKTLVLAHRMTGEERYLKAAWAALDFHNGCNPQGTTLTSGLGTVYPVAFLDLPSYTDGIAEYVPGITPYRWNYGMPAKAVEMVYGGNKALAIKCPIWRRWGNVENQTVAASEYTVWETIAPAAAVCAYLLEPTDTPPPVRPMPADDVRKLPGYWTIP